MTHQFNYLDKIIINKANAMSKDAVKSLITELEAGMTQCRKLKDSNGMKRGNLLIGHIIDIYNSKS